MENKDEIIRHTPENTFNRGLIYKEARKLAKGYLGNFGILILLIIIVNVVNNRFANTPNQVSQEIQTSISTLSIILSLASAWLSMGLINIALKLLDKKETIFSDGLVPFSKTIKTFIAAIINTLFISLGIIAFIVPGIIIGARLTFTTTLILDKDMGIWEAIVTSWNMTKGSVWNLIVLTFVMQITQILGILTFGIGLFRTFPFMFFAQTLAYRALRDHK